MVWRNLLRKSTDRSEDDAQKSRPEKPRARPRLEQVVTHREEERSRSTNDPDERRRAGLRRQRVAILYDIEQGELATSADNPWNNRINLLTGALETITSDLQRVSTVEPGPYHPMPATPIRIERVEVEGAAVVEFTIGAERFSYAEEPDWAERGHQIAPPELLHRAGDATELVPDDTPEHLLSSAQEHLAGSLFVFAASLRDHVLDGEPLPETPSVADLARPCPDCGGWTDWRGTCQACARRNAGIAALKREEARLLDDRKQEAEERHRLVEGLPIARRRLRDVETELARLGERFD